MNNTQNSASSGQIRNESCLIEAAQWGPGHGKQKASKREVGFLILLFCPWKYYLWSKKERNPTQTPKELAFGCSDGARSDGVCCVEYGLRWALAQKRPAEAKTE